jgi:signal transduction histidine kinase/ligand-binding sensor domain-containing protein
VPAQYRFDSWTTDNGLPQASVNSIVQTSDGFLWFTTYGGLVRYDGLRFQVFSTGNTPGLKASRFLWLSEDASRNLWISTEGQGVIRYADGHFKTYTKDNSLPSQPLSRFIKSPDGEMLLGFADGIFHLQGENFAAYPSPHGVPANNVIHETSGEGTWYYDGIHLRKFEKGRVIVDFVPGFPTRRVFEDSRGRLWMSGNGKLLSMLKDGKLTAYSEKDGYPPFALNTIFEDREGSVWFGTRGGGLVRLKDTEFSRYTTDDGLAGNDVAHVFEDREKTLWVGSTGGLTRMTQRAITAYDTKNGIAANNVYPLYEDSHGQIWIGSWRGLTRYGNGKFTNVGKEFGVEDILVSSLLEDREGRLWIGSWSEGIRFIKDGKANLFHPNDRTFVHTRAIIQDHDGAIWFGTGEGLIKYSNEVFTSYGARDGLVGTEIFELREDRQGQLWIGTDAGLSKFKDGRFTNFAEKDGIAPTIIRSIYEDDEGTLWIGTYDDGLYRLKQGRFTRYTTNEGLFDNGAFKIIEDGRGNFWISCNLGVYRVKKTDLDDVGAGRIKRLTSIPYNRRDGMLNSECNGGGQPAGLKAKDGRIWFPTQQGVVVINPATVPFNSQPPPVVIESFVVDTAHVPAHSPITIQPGQIYFEVNYSGLSFINPELVKFQYKLEGLDHDWIDAATRRVAYYSHLPAGKYRFVVKAANRDGVWNEQGAAIEIIVLPPFWRTWWFLAIAAVSVALTVYLLFRRRIVKLQLANRAQEEFSRRLIDSQESERKRIAAELHDSLGQSLLIIKNRAAMTRKFLDNRVLALEQIDQVEDVAAQSIKEVRQIVYDLRPYQIENIGLTEALRELVERVNESSPVRISADIAFVDDMAEAEAINLFRIMQEALNNIVKHSGATDASATIKRSEHEMLMVIEDNGRGFETHPSEGNNGRGLGLAGLAERARMLTGNLVVQSAIGQGTSVRLSWDMAGPAYED